MGNVLGYQGKEVLKIAEVLQGLRSSTAAQIIVHPPPCQAFNYNKDFFLTKEYKSAAYARLFANF